MKILAFIKSLFQKIKKWSEKVMAYINGKRIFFCANTIFKGKHTFRFALNVNGEATTNEYITSVKLNGEEVGYKPSYLVASTDRIEITTTIPSTATRKRIDTTYGENFEYAVDTNGENIVFSAFGFKGDCELEPYYEFEAKYTVTYISEGAILRIYKYAEGTTIGLPTALYLVGGTEPEGMKLTHWADQNGTEYDITDNPTVTLTEDMTFTAVYEEVALYSVFYCMPDGALIKEYANIKADTLHTVHKFATVGGIEPEGYIFTHWLHPDGTILDPEKVPAFKVTDNTTLTAVFVDEETANKVTVTYAWGGGLVVGVGEYERGEVIYTPYYNSFGYDLPIGTTFAYWQDEDSGRIYREGDQYIPNKSTTLVAVFVATGTVSVQYRIINPYEANTERSISHGHLGNGDSITLLPYSFFVANNGVSDYTYKFKYWIDEYGNTYNAGAKITVTNDLNLFPVFGDSTQHSVIYTSMGRGLRAKVYTSGTTIVPEHIQNMTTYVPDGAIPTGRTWSHWVGSDGHTYDGSNEYDLTVNKDIVLRAVYK